MNTITQASQFLSTKKEIKEWLSFAYIEDAYINPDLTVDVQGPVEITRLGLEYFPVKFGKVSGNFLCQRNELKSLLGAPHTVMGEFNCKGNSLKSLEHSPIYVEGPYVCAENELISLVGAPAIIKGSFDCSENELKSLCGGPRIVEGQYYNFMDNQIENFEGAPEIIKGSFLGLNNPIKSLEDLKTQFWGSLSVGSTDFRIPLLASFYRESGEAIVSKSQWAEIAAIIKERQAIEGMISLGAKSIHTPHKI